MGAAERVFSRLGYHPTKISDIVAEAGVGQGTFYRHFSSKRSMFLALFDRFCERLFAEFGPMSRDLPTDVDSYRAGSVEALSRMAALIETKPQATLLFLREGPSIDEEVAQRLEALYERFARLAQFYLDHAIEQGFARPCDSAVVSQALVGIGLRFLQRWSSGRVERPVSEMVAELVELAFTGFAKTEWRESSGRGPRPSGPPDHPTNQPTN